MQKVSLREIVRYWPLVVFGLSCTAHTDLVIFGHERFQNFFHVGLGALCLGIIIVGTFQLWFEYWFLGWARDDVWPKFRIAVTAWLHRKADWAWGLAAELGIQGALRELGFHVQAIRALVHEASRPLRFIWRVLRRGIRQWRFFKFLRGGGYGAIAVTSILPWPGTRTPAILICRASNSHKGIWVVAIGNAFRTWYLLYGLHVVLDLFR